MPKGKKQCIHSIEEAKANCQCPNEAKLGAWHLVDTGTAEIDETVDSADQGTRYVKSTPTSKSIPALMARMRWLVLMLMATRHK